MRTLLFILLGSSIALPLRAAQTNYPAQKSAPESPLERVFVAQSPLPWNRDFSSTAAYEKSVAPHRERLRELLDLPAGGFSAFTNLPATNRLSMEKLDETELYTVHAVRWQTPDAPALEGLLLEPKLKLAARLVAIPDACQTAESLAGLTSGIPPERQYARRLAAHGCKVLILAPRREGMLSYPSAAGLTNTLDNQDPLPTTGSITNETGSELRPALRGQILDALAAVAIISKLPTPENQTNSLKVGIAGCGDGGRIALFAAALDPAIDAALVSGAFHSPARLSRPPDTSDIPSVSQEFTDAQIAGMVAPRALIVEHSGGAIPVVSPKAKDAGTFAPHDYESVEAEFERATALPRTVKSRIFDRFRLISGTEGMPTGPASDRSLVALLNALGVAVFELRQPAAPSPDLSAPRPDKGR